MKSVLDNQDICARKHKGNPESIKAHENALPNKYRDRARIISFLKERGPYGATAYEIGQCLVMRHQTCSARCSELKASGVVVPSGERRSTDTGSKAAVLILPEFFRNQNL